MCSCFELIATQEAINQRFEISFSWNIPKEVQSRPTDPVLAITYQGPKLFHWGLKVDWSAKPIINARCETLEQKKVFSSLLKARCLIPASAYFEWRKDGKKKLKNRIALSDRTSSPLFSFAGLYDGEQLTIITCPPAKSISHIHDRMPVILNKMHERLWINPESSFATASNALVPLHTDKLKAEEHIPLPSPQSDLFISNVP
jgi:putative SOS response-associated peptidase YedK